jgi:WD40 repeat protein
LTKLETPVFAGAIADLDWDMESKKIVAVGEGSGMMAKVFAWDTGNSAGEMVGHNKRITSVAYKPTRPFKIMTGSEDMRTLFYAGPPFKLDHSNAPHTNFVNCVRYTPDGAKVVSVSSDKKIQFYDGTTGQPEAEIPNAHESSIYSASFNADGTKLATASADKTVKIWDVASLAAEKTFTFSADAQVGDMQVSIVWSGSRLLSVSLNGNINVLDLENPSSPSQIIQAHQTAITAMYLNAATHTLVTGGADGVVCVRDTVSKKAVRVRGTDKRNLSCASHSGKVVGIAIHNDEVISAGWDDTLRFGSLVSNAYNSEIALNGQPVALACSPIKGLIVVATNSEVALILGQVKVGTLSGHGYTATCVALYGTEEVAIGGDDNKTHVYSITGNVFTAVATLETRSPVSSVAYSAAGDALAVGDAGRQVELWERGSWENRIRGKWVFHTSKITTLSWSPNGAFLASGSVDESIIIWNVAKPSAKKIISFTHTGGVSGLAWGSDDSLVSAGADHCVASWKVATEAIV